MQTLLDLWSKSPARIVGLVVALMTLLISFGVQITTGQQEAITGIAIAIIVFLGGEVTRSQVSSPNTVATTAAMQIVTDAPEATD